MRNGLTNRIVRLETAQVRPSARVLITWDRFFIAWGRDEAEIEKTITAAWSSGTVQVGDIVVRAIWTDQKTPLPRSRWVANRNGEISPIEFDALADMEDALLGEIMQALHCPDFATLKRELPTPRFDYECLNDAQLIGLLFGRPLEAATP
jgi:hypothetical protein